MNVGRERLKNETFPPWLYLLCGVLLTGNACAHSATALQTDNPPYNALVINNSL